MYSAPCLLDDMIADPRLMWRMYEAIPQIADHPRRDQPVLGDLAKIGLSVVYYNGKRWLPCK